MRRFRPAAALLAVASLLPVATGAEAATTAAGAATSTATLASLSAVGHAVQVARLTAAAGTTSGTLAKITVQPLVVDGADAVDPVVVEPGSSPKSVPSAASPGALNSILTVSSPALTLSATGGEEPASGLTTPAGLGSLSVLGMPITIGGGLTVGSTVTKTKADAGKMLNVSDVALPSLADILSALGIDLAKLPASVLDDLVTQLPLVLSAAEQTAKAAADTAVANAQTAVDDASSGLAGAQSALSTATANLAAAETAAAAAQAAFEQALADAGISMPTWLAMPEEMQELTHPAIDEAEEDAADADALVTTREGELATAQSALTTATTTLNTKLAELQTAIGGLADVVEGIIGDAPLVSLGEASVGTLARVDSAKTATVTGSVSGLKVLDLDVLDFVTGSSALDVAGAADALVTEINGAIASVTNTLSDVLGNATGLVVPAPVVKVLEKTTSTGTDGDFGTAGAAVSLLSIRIPAITLPEDFALSAVLSSLPENITDLGGGLLAATGFEMSVGTLGEQARFRPASLTGAPGGGGSLPATGAPYGLALLAATAVAAGTLFARKARATA